MKKLIVCIALLLSTAAAQAQLHGATTTTVNSTISVTNAFQAALAANTGRAACVLQNTGTHTMYVYFGVLASATTSNGFQIAPGQTISCNVPGVVLQDAVNITGTAGDGYIVTSQ
jgi:hypothetical protein